MRLAHFSGKSHQSVEQLCPSSRFAAVFDDNGSQCEEFSSGEGVDAMSYLCVLSATNAHGLGFPLSGCIYLVVSREI